MTVGFWDDGEVEEFIFYSRRVRNCTKIDRQPIIGWNPAAGCYTLILN